MNLTRNMCNLMMCKTPQTNNPPQNQVHYGPMVIFVCLHITQPHYYHYADVSTCRSIELLKCLFGLFCHVCVWKIKSILSIIFHAIYEAVFIQLTQSCCDNCKNTCILSHYHQIGSILPLFRVKSWNNGMRRLSMFLYIQVTLLKSLPHLPWANELMIVKYSLVVVK